MHLSRGRLLPYHLAVVSSDSHGDDGLRGRSRGSAPFGMSTKVLVLACAIMAVLGSFWGIVWFIRAYVEPPRVMMPAPLVLAARESTPAPAPPPRAEAKPPATQAPPAVIEAQAAPAQPAAAAPPPAAARNADPASPSGSIADRWSAMDQFAPSAAPAPAPPPAPMTAPMAAPIESAPAALATATPDPTTSSKAPCRRSQARRRCRAASRSSRRRGAPSSRRCRVRVPRAPLRQACGPRCRRRTTGSRRNSDPHSITAPASIRTGA